MTVNSLAMAPVKSRIESWPPDGSRMARAMQAKDWSATSLGALRGWPASLRTAVTTVLESPQPTMLLVGLQLVRIFNDAFLPWLGKDGQSALGTSARQNPSVFFQISDEAIRLLLETGQPASFVVTVGEAHREDQCRLRQADLTLMPSRDGEGRIQAIIAYAREFPRMESAKIEAMLTYDARTQAAAGTASNEKPVDGPEPGRYNAIGHRDRVIATLAHELRAPLGALHAVATLLASPTLRQQDIARYQAVIARQVTHMTCLTENVLDSTRASRNAMTIERSPVDLVEVARAAAEAVGQHARARGHRLVLELDQAGAMVSGERTRLVQVLTNLLGNAIKFTPAPGLIRVVVAAHARKVVITVADNGIGMSPQVMASAFDFFTQASTTSERHTGGLGIGLALVRTLVHLHGGTVQAASAGAGKGALFTVTLPRC